MSALEFGIMLGAIAVAICLMLLATYSTEGGVREIKSWFAERRLHVISAEEASLEAERECGLVFDEVVMLPGYYVYRSSITRGAFFIRDADAPNWAKAQQVSARNEIIDEQV